jgi:hypothetical protein
MVYLEVPRNRPIGFLEADTMNIALTQLCVSVSVYPPSPDDTVIHYAASLSVLAANPCNAR